MSSHLAGRSNRKRSQQMGIRIDSDLFEQTKTKAETLGFRGYTNYILALLELANRLEDPIQVLELCQTPKEESFSFDELIRAIVKEELEKTTNLLGGQEKIAPTKEIKQVQVSREEKYPCPYCGANQKSQMKYGKNRQGNQRFYCNQCKKTYARVS